MRASAERVLRRWGQELPGYGTLLSCLCFAREECGDYAVAEPAGWGVIAIDPADYRGVYALAHVMEMQGRRGDGVALLRNAEARMGDCLSAFTLPHWMLALAATARYDVAERMNRIENVRAILALAMRGRPPPLESRIGYAGAARQFAH